VGKEWFSECGPCLSLVVQAIVSVVVPTSWCVGLWCVVCGVELVGVGVIVAHRPARNPSSDVLRVVGLAVRVSVQALIGVLAALQDHPVPTTTIQHLHTALSVLSLLLMVVSCVKNVHTAVVFWWERSVAARSDVSGEKLQHEAPLLSRVEPPCGTSHDLVSRAQCPPAMHDTIRNSNCTTTTHHRSVAVSNSLHGLIVFVCEQGNTRRSTR
jgi:hypothetical protein